MIKSILYLLLFFLFSFFGQPSTDSLTKKLASLSNKDKVLLLNVLSDKFRDKDPLKAKNFAEQAAVIAKKMNNDSLIAITSLALGVSYRNTGDSKTALDQFLNALLIAEKMQDIHLQADAIHKIGVTYLFQKDFSSASRFAAREEAIWKQLNDKAGLSAAYNFHGLIFSNLKNYDSALIDLKEALRLGKELNNEDLIYKPLTNIGDVYFRMGDGEQAAYYINQGLDLSRKSNNQFGISVGLINLGKANLLKKNYAEARKLLEEGLQIATTARAYPLIRNAYNFLSETNEKMGNYADALKYQRMYKIAEDSLINKNTSKQITDLESRYKAEKQEQTVKILEQAQFISRLFLGFLTLAILLVLVVVFALLARYRTKQEAYKKQLLVNEEIKTQNLAIEKQNKTISIFNKNITDSLNYAKTIQDALLPTTADELKEFTDYFVLNRPRDIIGGDFCWFGKKNHFTIIALGDCTGHGVPAALITVMCNSLMLELVAENNFSMPSEMLARMNERMLKTFGQMRTGGDGVEMGLCMIDTKERQLHYAGAKVALYLVKSDEFQVLKPDRVPVGDVHYPINRVYKNHSIDYNRGDTFYMSSDGFQDQFGEENGKKFLNKNLIAFLAEINKQQMKKQAVLLQEKLQEWQGSQKQTDDILVLGVRL